MNNNNNDVKEEISRVENNELFFAFKKQKPQAYLAHVFVMKKVGALDKQIGYYDPESETITTFSSEPVREAGSDEALTKNGDVKELVLGEVTLSLTQAKSCGVKIVDEHYGGQTITQEICILQHLEEGVVWNLTLITSSFNMINVRIDAATGKVIKHEQHSLMSLGSPM